MVVTDGPMLEIATEEKSLAAEPDDYIHVVWPRVEALQMPEDEERTRQIIGWIGAGPSWRYSVHWLLHDRPNIHARPSAQLPR